MLKLFTKRTFPIGVDLSGDYLRMAQLGFDGERILLSSSAGVDRPQDIAPGSPEWQKWAVWTIRELIKACGFKGKSVITALPCEDVFIDQLRLPKMPEKKIAQAASEKVGPKLPFPIADAMIKVIPLDSAGSSRSEIDVLVMATPRVKIARHLAIYENAGLDICGMSVWPEAMISSFVHFFSRRQEEADTIALLIGIENPHTNIVICRQKDLLFARSIPIGFNQLRQGEMVQRLIAEIDACTRYFDSVAGGQRIQRLMFLAGKVVESDICAKIADLARRLQIPAQLGDVLSAVDKQPGSDAHIDRRNNRTNWATPFGLSLTNHSS
ncbi:MAG: pilus assembly protein PilM [Phycisphaerae bacterium]|nr:pilus assembly protein PilM [Phycisphaerae bacterium]